MRKIHKNPKGGLTAAGRAYFKRKEGANLKPPVKRGVNPRRIALTENETSACIKPLLGITLSLKHN